MSYFIELNENYFEINCYYRRDFYGYEMPFHAHDRYEIMLVENGKLSIQFLDNKGCKTDIIPIPKNHFVFIEANVYHKMVMNKEDTCKVYDVELTPKKIPDSEMPVISLKKLFLQNSFLEKVFSNKFDYYLSNDTFGVKETMIKTQNELDEHNCMVAPETFSILHALITQMVINIGRCIYEDNNYKGILYVKKTVLYIIKNYQENITVKQITENVGINITYLQKLFKQATGKTIVEYINNYRIEKAKILLKNTDFPIIDIAVEVGFNNRQNFHNTFKRYTGKSPIKFKKMYL